MSAYIRSSSREDTTTYDLIPPLVVALCSTSTRNFAFDGKHESGQLIRIS